jgi:Helicase associated domain
MLARAQVWARLHGHSTVPVKEEFGGHRLGAWLSRMRHKATAGHLPAVQVRALDAIDPHWHPPWPQDWQRRYHHAKAALATSAPDTAGTTGTTGTVRPYVEYQRRTAANWIATQQHHFFHLHPGQQALLFALRIAPAPGSRARLTAYIGVGHAAVFLAREGHLDVPPDHREPWGGPPRPRDPQAFALGAWLHHHRAQPGSLPWESRRALEALLATAEHRRPDNAGPQDTG